MKLITWNVNGLRSVLGKGLAEFVRAEKPDFLLLQETKVDPGTLDWDWLPGYHRIWNPALKRGYSGTGILTRHAPVSVRMGMGIAEHDQEGRIIALEYPAVWIVCVYTPNSRNELRRLPYRQRWDADFLTWVKQLEAKKPVLFAGDLNVAHREIDIARPAANRFNAGFTDEERAGFSNIVNAGFLDVFREFDQSPGRYSWWSFRANARAKNIGWRIDYWCSSPLLRPALRNCVLRPEIMGSDHCPVVLETTGNILTAG